MTKKIIFVFLLIIMCWTVSGCGAPKLTNDSMDWEFWFNLTGFRMYTQNIFDDKLYPELWNSDSQADYVYLQDTYEGMTECCDTDYEKYVMENYVDPLYKQWEYLIIDNTDIDTWKAYEMINDRLQALVDEIRRQLQFGGLTFEHQDN